MILMVFTHMIDVDVTFKLTQDQGHEVKGQGQIKLFGKKGFVYKTRMGDLIWLKLRYMIDIDT